MRRTITTAILITLAAFGGAAIPASSRHPLESQEDSMGTYGRNGVSNSVPIERSALGLIYVSAEIDGNALRMIVDTGANRTILDKSAAGRLGIQPVGEPLDVAGCVTSVAREAAVGGLRVGPVLLQQRAITVLDLSSMKPQLGEIDGILGGDVLAATDAVIDYGAKELRLDAPGGERPDSHRQRPDDEDRNTTR